MFGRQYLGPDVIFLVLCTEVVLISEVHSPYKVDVFADLTICH